MALFSYRALDANGRRQSGKIEKNSEQEVLDFLKTSGLLALDIHKVGVLNRDLGDLAFFQRRITTKAIAVFCRQLSFVLGAGLELPRAFQILSGQNNHPRFKKILLKIYEQLLKGQSLSSCFEEAAVFPSLLTGMCRIGERSGRLAAVMGTTADYYEKESKTGEAFLSAMVYPAIVSIMMLGVMIMAVVFVVPNYVQVFSAADIPLPLPTQILIRISQAVTRYYVWIVLIAILAFLALRYFLGSRSGKVFLGFIKMHTLGVKTVCRKTMNLRFCQSMGVMLASGQPVAPSIAVARHVIANLYLDTAMNRIMVGVEEGRPLWALLAAQNFFGPLLVSMIQVGEETGLLSDTVVKCATYFQNEADAMVAMLNKLVEPAITIILGLALAFIMLSIMLPTFALTNAM